MIVLIEKRRYHRPAVIAYFRNTSRNLHQYLFDVAGSLFYTSGKESFGHDPHSDITNKGPIVTHAILELYYLRSIVPPVKTTPWQAHNSR